MPWSEARRLLTAEIEKNWAKKNFKKKPNNSLLHLLDSTSLRRCEAFARGISEETSVSMRLREALGTLEASTGFFFPLGGMLSDVFLLGVPKKKMN